MIKYYIGNFRSKDKNESYWLQISEDNFNQLKGTKKYLLDALFIEENWQLVILNYAEIEKEALNITLNSMTSSMYYDWSSYRDEFSLLNLKIGSFLSITRFYRDSLKHIFSSIYGKNVEEYRWLENRRCQERKLNLSYRTMEAIRNHSQHYGLPVHRGKISSPLIDNQGQFFAKYAIDIITKVSILELNDGFGKDRGKKNELPNLITELKKKFGDDIDLMLLIREYLDSLGRIHKEVRECLKPNVQNWDKIIIDAIQCYESKGDITQPYILIKIDEDEQKMIELERIDIFIDFITRRQQLERKYGNVTHYSRNFISNEITKKQDGTNQE